MKYFLTCLVILLSFIFIGLITDCNLQTLSDMIFTTGGTLALITPFVVSDEGDSFLGSKNLDLGTCHAYIVDKESVNLVGTVSTTIGSPVVTGTGTTFLTSFKIGDWIFITGFLKPLQIKSITSNTVLDLKLNATSTLATATYQNIKVYFQGGFDKLSLKLGVKKTDLKESQGGDNASDKIVTGYTCDVEFGQSRTTLQRLAINLQGSEIVRDTNGEIKGFAFTYAGGSRDSDSFKKLILVKIISGIESIKPLDTIVIPKCSPNVEAEFSYDATSQRFTKTMFTGYIDPETIYNGKAVICFMGDITV